MPILILVGMGMTVSGSLVGWGVAKSSQKKLRQGQKCSGGLKLNLFGRARGFTQEVFHVKRLAREAGASSPRRGDSDFDKRLASGGETPMTAVPTEATETSIEAENSDGRAHADNSESDAADLELWVETDLEASWCIGHDEASESSWRDKCTTASVQRRWDEFEALEALSQRSRGRVAACQKRYSDRLPPHDIAANLKVLGLTPQQADPREVRAAFKRRSLACHPDKGGSVEEFRMLVKAYESLVVAGFTA